MIIDYGGGPGVFDGAVCFGDYAFADESAAAQQEEYGGQLEVIYLAGRGDTSPGVGGVVND